MIPLSLELIAQITTGKLVLPENLASAEPEKIIVNNISTNSRTITSGQVFLALKGDNFDGHNFIGQVIKQGCAAVIVNRLIDRNSGSVIQIVVNNTHTALGQIGAYIKQQVSPKTVAITGSSGKTTVKEMTSAILSQLGNVLATKGNFNNDIGVPLTLLRLEKQHQYAVVELGANHQGEIAYTSNLVKPDVALINNIAPAHLAGFGDLDGVAQAKSEIFSGLTEQGVGIFSQTSPYLDDWKNLLEDKRYCLFSGADKASKSTEQLICWSVNETLNANGCASFTLKSHTGAIDISLSLPGRHNIDNAVAAAAIGFSFGAGLLDIQQGLASLAPVKGRLNTVELSANFTLIDDTYNANVDSVNAASELLGSLNSQSILILADMGELGSEAKNYHQQVGRYAQQVGVDILLTVGKLSQFASDSFNKEQGQETSGHHFTDKQALITYFSDLVTVKNQSITVLVKGSRSARMEEVVADIKQWHSNKYKTNNADESPTQEVKG